MTCFISTRKMEQQELNNLLDSISCTFQSSKHLFEDPIILPCGKSACKKCLLKNSESIKKKFICGYCRQTHKLSDKFLKENYDQNKINLINSRLKYLYEASMKRLEIGLNTVESRLEDSVNTIEVRKNHIESELLIKVEDLKDHVMQLEQDIRELLNKSVENLTENLIKYKSAIKPELDAIKIFISNGSELNHENGMKKCEELNLNLEKINKSLTNYFNDLKFEVNNELPNEEIIGYMNRIKLNDDQIIDEIKLNELKSTENVNSFYQNIPISPRYVAVNKNLIYLTDTFSKSILKLSEGKFEKSLLQNTFKSPEGVCFNELNEMFVTDYESNLVFKFDKNLNLIKSFGSKVLKHPKGIACDNIEHNSMIYVCDYL